MHEIERYGEREEEKEKERKEKKREGGVKFLHEIPLIVSRRYVPGVVQDHKQCATWSLETAESNQLTHDSVER